MANSWPPMSERGPAVTEHSVAAFEAHLGTPLPKEYREFLLDVNGGQTATSHVVFPIKNDRTNLNSLNSIDGANPRFDLKSRWEGVRHRLPSEVLPIGYDDGGGTIVVVVSGPKYGQVWFLDGVDPRPEGSNSRVEWFDRRDVSKLANTFREFMNSLTPLQGEQ